MNGWQQTGISADGRVGFRRPVHGSQRFTPFHCPMSVWFAWGSAIGVAATLEETDLGQTRTCLSRQDASFHMRYDLSGRTYDLDLRRTWIKFDVNMSESQQYSDASWREKHETVKNIILLQIEKKLSWKNYRIKTVILTFNTPGKKSMDWKADLKTHIGSRYLEL